jgi:hypothetical protein
MFYVVKFPIPGKVFIVEGNRIPILQVGFTGACSKQQYYKKNDFEMPTITFHTVQIIACAEDTI